MCQFLHSISKVIVYTFLLIAIPSFTLHAQNSNLNKARSSLKKGEYATALEFVELAVLHKKTKSKPETYILKSKIIKTMMFKKDSASNNTESKLYDDWKKAMSKAKEVSKGNDKYKFLLDNSINQLSISYFNIGVVAYQNKNSEGAFNIFSRAYDINNKNLSALQNAATIGVDLEKYQVIEPFYEKLISGDSVDVNNVFRYINILAYKQKKYEKGLEVVEKMLPKFPNNKDLQEQEINMYERLNKLDEAINKLENKLKQDANPNPEQYIRLGQFYEHLKNEEKKLESYKTAYSLDKKNIIVLQNIGVYYYNKAVSIKNSVGKLSDKEYAKKGSALLKKADIQFSKAAEYFEAIVIIEKKDKETLEHLLNIYQMLKKKDKVKSIEAKLKGL